MPSSHSVRVNAQPTPQEAGKLLDGWDDEQLLAALRESMRARQVVPDAFVDIGKSAYAWHNIDAELAQLTYDSSRERDRDQLASTRSETALIRALTFTSAHLTLELRSEEHTSEI